GHPPALLMSASGQTRYVHTTGGQAVGILKNPRFVARSVHLGPGDTLALYTDGLTEARTGPNRRFDDHDDFLGFARRESPTDAATFVAAVQRLLDGFGAGLEDDTAVIAVSVPPHS
ncbi:PP2C family protein-serine/threonine phosphatase, partial [Mycolicibacterium vaccae]